MVKEKIEEKAKESYFEEDQPKTKKQSSVKFAVIKVGGKQYKVKEDQELLVEKIEEEDGKAHNFPDVLLVVDGETVKVGTPIVSGAKVEGKVLSQEKGDKVIVFKMKAKKRYRRKNGHRQKYTKVKIEKISA